MENGARAMAVLDGTGVILEMENGARAMAVLDGTPDGDLGHMVVEVTSGEKRHMAAIL
eukprot:gene60049-82145_t